LTGTPGAVRVHGTVFDGARDPVPDALIETWQASPDGRFPHPDDPRGAVETAGVRGWARVPTDGDGRFSFLTVKPGALPHPSGAVEAPHINVTVLTRGLLNRLVTRIYFPDEAAANDADPVHASLPDPSRRSTLMAVAQPDGTLRFDIHLQGDRETVFFAV
jgi:protocatechuate 3,4-dioxygenase alpha subunit